MSKEMIEFFVRNGKHSMPFFRKTEINDEELKNLSEYLSK
ncbi:c-type cytochrome [Campylobacter gastrosuis]|uniref:Cytochrome c n=1 Tax=Campylobacter gastrosuis TaxID=2974576 RepID=A0ABT7HPL8_9BACT|nr:cytochrome c [Campylobacter gastrosuis]MDL0088595.1 cytochrome c [Campylobacter gastrosuis]